MEKSYPDWVLMEARKKSEYYGKMSLETVRHCVTRSAPWNETLVALCDMILKYEKKPVSRELLCAREANAADAVTKADKQGYLSGDWDYTSGVKQCLSAIRLYKEGFGQ